MQETNMILWRKADQFKLGTEFGVEVGSQKQSEIHVFKGEVEVNTPEWLNESLRLYTDQGTLEVQLREENGDTVFIEDPEVLTHWNLATCGLRRGR
jgi:hypothetical protein